MDLVVVVVAVEKGAQGRDGAVRTRLKMGVCCRVVLLENSMRAAGRWAIRDRDDAIVYD